MCMMCESEYSTNQIINIIIHFILVFVANGWVMKQNIDVEKEQGREREQESEPMRKLFPITELILFKFGIATYRPEQPNKKGGEKRPKNIKRTWSQRKCKLRQIEEVMLIFNAEANDGALAPMFISTYTFSPSSALLPNCNLQSTGVFFFFFRFAIATSSFVVVVAMDAHWAMIVQGSSGIAHEYHGSSGPALVGNHHHVSAAASPSNFDSCTEVYLRKVFFRQFSAFLSFMSLPFHCTSESVMTYMQYAYRWRLS